MSTPTTVEPDVLPAQTAHVTDVAISLGPLFSVLVDVVAKTRQGRKTGTGLSRMCPHPDHDEPCSTNQMYVCSEDPAHVMKEGETMRGRLVEDHGIVLLTDEEIDTAILAGQEKSLLEVKAFPALQVEQSTRPKDTGFRVRPRKKAPSYEHAHLDALTKIVERHPEIAFVGEAVIKGSRSLYRLTVWRGQLYIQGIYVPSDIEPVHPDELPAMQTTEDDIALMESMMLAEIGDFTDDAFKRDDQAEIAEALAARAASGEKAEKVAEVDPLDAIRAAATVTPPKPKATRKPAAKTAAKKAATKPRKKVA